MEWMELLSVLGVVGSVLAAFFGHLSLSSPLNRLVKLTGTLESLKSYDQESFEYVRAAVQNLSRKISKKEEPWEDTSRMLLLSVCFYFAAAIIATFAPLLIDSDEYPVRMFVFVGIGLILLILGAFSFGWVAVHQLAETWRIVGGSRKHKKSGRASKKNSQSNDAISDTLGNEIT
ncbi:hypothetical protein ICM05_04360 [Leucobacter sp. cx-42]|uniref:hypothetical protein n=1 Tax=unclassified Leucobacter TaxID=2621730 RepID=UPI00165DA8D8|nr:MULTISPECIES: hypothetical protein [unclassified Leucobacter]MBC9953879.1 hypothetical protein [Leucobacter sp. cx-42]